MTLNSLFYRFAYQFGRPHWDTGDPRPELKELADRRAPGRALDIGCGTGTNCLYLAGHGWEVVGVDFVPKAIESANAKAERAGLAVRFQVGDVTRLREAGVRGPFDLLVDVGCYHGIPDSRRGAYAAEAAAAARPGADFLLAGFADPPAVWRLFRASGATSSDLQRRFSADFEVVSETAAEAGARASRLRLYHLIRK